MLGIKNDENEERIYNALLTITVLLNYTWLNTHWLFIWHYLQVACLFKMTFMYHNVSLLAKLEHRRKLLNILQVGVLLTLAIVFLSFIAFEIYVQISIYILLFPFINALSSAICAIVLSLALRHI